jgi:hypothetical protein
MTKVARIREVFVKTNGTHVTATKRLSIALANRPRVVYHMMSQTVLTWEERVWRRMKSVVLETIWKDYVTIRSECAAYLMMILRATLLEENV